ncbi:MAG: TolC family protein [Bacteroidia bacterium]|nr:TolC family protein [Bacteroidia bacterium]
MKKFIRKIALALCVIATCYSVEAQRVLTLQDCRSMALEDNKNMQISQENVKMAEYDRKIARANYFPKISATGTYMYNNRRIQLLSDDQLNGIGNAGTLAAQGLGDNITQTITDLFQFAPDIQQLILQSDLFKNFIQSLPNASVFQSLNAVGDEIVNTLTPDTRNITAGIITVEEPIYVGGKIRAYNKIADFAQELALSKLSTEQQEIIATTDQAYWQIVSLASKLKLTESYVELLRTMTGNVDKLVDEGMATNADRLSIKVKLNEGEMTLLKVQNGLTLSKMLLCQRIGLPLDSDIKLADEDLEDVEVPAYQQEYDEEFIMENRPELKSLNIATQIYDKKVNIARSEFLPTVAFVGNYIVSNPSLFNGFEKQFNGMFNIGVVAKIPIYHFGEGANKIRKAKSEAAIQRMKLDETKELIMLQVSQYENKIKEAESRLTMTTEKMSDAEENLRMATLGFNEGIVPSSTLNAAQTAWLQAHSDFIDAKIDVIMSNTYLKKAVGSLNQED